MSIFSKFRDWLLSPLIGGETRKTQERIELIRDYYIGDQKTQLKTRPNQMDYNAIANVIRTVIDDTTALLFGYGVEFDLPGEGDTPQDEYLKEVWDLSKQQVLLHNVSKVGSETGTCAIKIIENGVYSSKLSRSVPRLVPQDTVYLTIKTVASDVDQHTKYIIEYAYTKDDGKEGAHKQEIERVLAPNLEGPPRKSWVIVDYEIDARGEWVEESRVIWDKYFPPLIVWQNLPDIRSPKGIPDVTNDTIRAQDKLNFVLSDIIKTNSLYAHPKLVAKNASLGESVDGATDSLIEIAGPDADMTILEMNSELIGSLSLFDKIRSIIFDTTGTVDTAALIASGDMTNFRVKVAFQKALQKLHVKRELYGDALININKYLLILGGFGDDPDPGRIVWPEVLPVNDQEQATSLQTDLNMGIVSKQTVSKKRGYKWTDEEKRIADEKTAEGDIGTTILNAFNVTGQ